MPLNDSPGNRGNITDALLPLLTLAEAQRALEAQARAADRLPPLRILGRDPSPAPGRFLLERTAKTNGTLETWPRVLDGVEILGYARGALAAAGLHNRIPTHVRPQPVMYSVEEAAAEFTTATVNDRTGVAHLTKDGIISRISTGRLEVVYLRRRERAIFADEIAAIRHDATDEDQLRWQDTRERFGLPYRMEITDAHIPAAAGTLPINPNKPFILGAAKAVMIADREGWLEYHAPLEDPEGDVEFHIPYIGGAAVTEPASRILPWLLGVADHVGPHAAELIAYRPGLV